MLSWSDVYELGNADTALFVTIERDKPYQKLCNRIFKGAARLCFIPIRRER